MSVDLSILTLNCWGIPIVSKNRKARMKAIGEILTNGKFDVVCLQEVWSNADYEIISTLAKSALPYGHYFHSGVVGSGICILSKYVIKETFFHQWPVNGYIHKLQHGDWFGGKGVALCRIQVSSYIVNVYSAHFHAEYNRIFDEYRAHRVMQAFDTAQFIRLTSGSANAVILAGDLNTEPNDLEYRLLLESSNLRDSFTVKNVCNIEENGTNECARNSYTPAKLCRSRPEGKRIDYILYKPGRHTVCDLIKYCLPFPDRVPTCSFSYSDHEAVQILLKLSPPSGDTDETDSNSPLMMTLKEGLEVCKQSLQNLHRRKIFFYIFALICVILLLTIANINVPYQFKVLIVFIELFLSFTLFFNILMATLWDSMERNATYATIHSMELFLKYVAKVTNDDEESPFQL
ncbi:putative neutral sphingomyelinase [Chrysoperla carnea]|uniref:putative neutral sphingomyelinase n=1 Tax=Chrysoperla carnea TaxID=189513 RepID=UPI001D0644BA|nr:putative neutral sphingomyelinase [Chrysoperla carnea]